MNLCVTKLKRNSTGIYTVWCHWSTCLCFCTKNTCYHIYQFLSFSILWSNGKNGSNMLVLHSRKYGV